MRNIVNLSNLNSKEILEPSFFKSYEETLDVIWQELFKLNSYLFVLDKLLQFSTNTKNLFLGPDRQNFLTLVSISFTDSSLLIITKLTTDKKGEFLSILWFKNKIREWIKEKYLEDFNRLLRENKFSRTVDKLKKKAKDIRDNRIAHIIVDKNLQLKESPDRISLEEISQITHEINKLFSSLCFNCEYMLLPLSYDPRVQHPKGSDSRSDIEYILDLLVQDSYLYKEPDESPYWAVKRPRISQDVLDTINMYRQKFGKPVI
jgi:hypothetical protein